MAGSVQRSILHADMDAFYASVEQRDDPSLRGRPVAVGGTQRGVVAAASYEARRFGVRSALPMRTALRLCPELVVVPPRIGYYAEVSRAVFSIFESFTPLVEPLSLDEAFLDLSGTERLHGAPIEIARAIKRRVREELQLVVSVGVAPSKLLAKIASDMGKPDGLVVVQPDEVQRFLHPLPVSRLFGVGKVTEAALRDLGVATVGDLAALPREVISRRLGSVGEQLWDQAQGRDEREVVSDREPDSIGAEETFVEDLRSPEELEPRVQDQADRVAHRLRAQGYRAGAVVLKLKTADFALRTRRRKLPKPSSDGNVLGSVARELLRRLLRGLGAVRLTGVTATQLVRCEEPRQLSFDEPQREQGERLGQTLDEITSRFGEGALVRATSLDATRPRRRR